ncbi:hypothetical protein [Synechococcus sp. KORDI-52]|uniref:hypothetical protein n=1 Tax=Synechococcus sp. KORDI-52 TaxID=585425 RepID=UPI0012EB9021|nr:hypothetical protein [Synechococcus sp. KORDI-52]
MGQGSAIHDLRNLVVRSVARVERQSAVTMGLNLPTLDQNALSSGGTKQLVSDGRGNLMVRLEDAFLAI